MFNKEKSEEKTIVKVVPRLPKSVAEDYTEPRLHKVSTKIEVDTLEFKPEYIGESSKVSLKVKLEDTLRLPHRSIATLYCGCSIEIPSGYRASFEIEGPYKSRGLFVISGSCGKRVEITVINLGREIVQINNGDVVAAMSLEVVHWFDWIYNDGK